MSVPRHFATLVSVALTILWAANGAAAAPIVTDPETGLAINGFDPVAYFAEAAPRAGRPDMEYRLNGVIWRFRNAGNRAAFADDPNVYAPQFGGYDPVAIARGASVPGHPMFWLVTGQRLYLFYSKQARDEFAAQPQNVLVQAQRRWSEVQRSLP